jgi:hypothetical protein
MTSGPEYISASTADTAGRVHLPPTMPTIRRPSRAPAVPAGVAANAFLLHAGRVFRRPEADYQFTGLNGKGISLFRLGYSASTGVNTSVTVDQSVKSLGTVRLRMGAVPANPKSAFSPTARVDWASDTSVQASTSHRAGQVRWCLLRAAILTAAGPPARVAFPAHRRRRGRMDLSAPAPSTRSATTSASRAKFRTSFLTPIEPL